MISSVICYGRNFLKFSSPFLVESKDVVRAAGLLQSVVAAYEYFLSKDTSNKYFLVHSGMVLLDNIFTVDAIIGIALNENS